MSKLRDRWRFDGRSETRAERADRNWNDILQEARVIQTCTQILGGFLLALAFQPRFTELDGYQLNLYLVLVALAGIATALGLSLVTMHRRLFSKLQKARVVRIGNRLLIANLLVVSLLAALVTSLIFDFVVNRPAGMIALVVGLLISLSFWTTTSRVAGSEWRSRIEPAHAQASVDDPEKAVFEAPPA